MQQYLDGQGYWAFVAGTLETKLIATSSNLTMWEQGANHGMYCLATCVHDHMLSYIRDVESLKAVWVNLKRLFTVTASKLQLWQELNNIHQANLSCIRQYAQDQGSVRFARCHQRQHRRQWDGTDLPRRVHTAAIATREKPPPCSSTCNRCW